MSKNKPTINCSSISSSKQQYVKRILSTKNSTLSSLSPNKPKQQQHNHNLQQQPHLQQQALSSNTRKYNALTRSNIENLEQIPIETDGFNDFIPQTNLNSGLTSIKQSKVLLQEKETPIVDNCQSSIQQQQNISIQQQNLDLQKDYASNTENVLSKSANNFHDSVLYNTCNSISKLTSQRKKTLSPMEEQANKVDAMKNSTRLDIINELKKVIHKLQLKDAIQRQEISKLKKQNDSMITEIQLLEEKVTKLEKARQIDNQYLMKLDNQLLQDKRQKSAKKSTSPNRDRYDRNEKIEYMNQQQQKKIEELTTTTQKLKETINYLSSEKLKLEDIIKNLLLEKELQKRSMNTILNDTNRTLQYQYNDLLSPQSPKFVDDYNHSGLTSAKTTISMTIGTNGTNTANASSCNIANIANTNTTPILTNILNENINSIQRMHKDVIGEYKNNGDCGGGNSSFKENVKGESYTEIEKRQYNTNNTFFMSQPTSSSTITYYNNYGTLDTEPHNTNNIFWDQSFEKIDLSKSSDNIQNNSICHDYGQQIGQRNDDIAQNIMQQKNTMSFSNDYCNDNMNGFQVSPSMLDIYNPTMPNDNTCNNMDSISKDSSKERQIIDKAKLTSQKYNLNTSNESIKLVSNVSSTKNILYQSCEIIRHPGNGIRGLNNSSIGFNQSLNHNAGNLPELLNKMEATQISP